MLHKLLIDVMDTRKMSFEMFLNAIHYSMFHLLLYFHFKFSNLIIKLTPSKYKKKVENNIKKSEYRLYLDPKKGFAINTIHFHFGYISSGYFGFFSFILLGIKQKTQISSMDNLDIILIALPIVIGFTPVYLCVLKNDRYLSFYKIFETRGSKWHKKWQRITILYCIFSILAIACGVFVMDYIIRGV